MEQVQEWNSDEATSEAKKYVITTVYGHSGRADERPALEVV